MKKFINDPFDFVEELTEGIIKAHGDYYRADKGDLRIIVRQDAPIKGKVAIATGGGSGHLPVFMGYVGKGLADGACIGNVFSSPSAGQMKRVTKAIDGGAGVLYLYGRYQGDMMNFNSAAEESIKNGIRVESVIVSDDVASAPPERQGAERIKMRTADEIAATLVDRVVNDMPFVAGDEVAVLVNSLGATPLEELYVLYRKIDELLREKGLVLHRPYVGRYACSMEMQGMSLSLMKLDDELKRLLDAPADSPFFKQF